jgi:hypothetical protein
MWYRNLQHIPFWHKINSSVCDIKIIPPHRLMKCHLRASLANARTIHYSRGGVGGGWGCLALTPPPPPKKILSLEPPKFFLAKIGKFGQFAVKFHVTPPPSKIFLRPLLPKIFGRAHVWRELSKIGKIWWVFAFATFSWEVKLQSLAGSLADCRPNIFADKCKIWMTSESQITYYSDLETFF